MIEIHPLDSSHYERVATWLSDPDIHRWLASGWHGKHFSAQHVAVLVASPANALFLIEESGRPAGLVALSEIDRVSRSANAWYLVDAAHRGRRVARTSLHALSTRAFRDLAMESLNAWITRGNDASRRVLEAVGFREVGVLRRASRLDGEPVDRILFDLLPEDLAASGES